MIARPNHPPPPAPPAPAQRVVEIPLSGTWLHKGQHYRARLLIRTWLCDALVRAALAARGFRATAAGGAFAVLCERVSDGAPPPRSP